MHVLSLQISSKSPIRNNCLCSKRVVFFFILAQQPPVGHGLLNHEVSRRHTQRRTIVGRTPLDEGLARRRDLYLTTLNTQHLQTDIHAPGGIRTQNLSRRAAPDRAAIGTGSA